MKKIILATGIATTLVMGGTTLAEASDHKVTICHATGSETNPFVELTLSENAVFGPGGHFNENGTPLAGHEDDIFGPCPVIVPPTDEDPETPPTDEDPETPPTDEDPETPPTDEDPETPILPELPTEPDTNPPGSDGGTKGDEPVQDSDNTNPQIETPDEPGEEIVKQVFNSKGQLVEQRVSKPIPASAQQEGM